MKNLFLIIISFVLLSSSCKKSKPSNPIDQLPPETQTGANTFGCLVNGEVFKPGGAQLSGGSLSCNYQFLNGGYYFRLAAIYRNNTNGSGKSIGIISDSLAIIEKEKFLLTVTRSKGKISSGYSSYQTQPIIIYDDYSTTSNIIGELLINKLDTINQIVSGAFWFDAINGSGQKVEVRKGRFDVRYTR